MGAGFVICVAMAGVFLICAVVFALLKEKAAVLVSGFNALPKQEQAKYDRAKLCRDMRNSFSLWFAIFAIGALLSYFFSSAAAVFAFIVWLILFFKDVHLDINKAFGRYKLH